jgi:putative peptidoglycan lipid II flippase
MAPATLGVAAVQVNVVVNSSFASLISGWRAVVALVRVPADAASDRRVRRRGRTTTLTQLSDDAAGRTGIRMRETLQRGLRMVLFLTVPSTVGLALLGVPIVRLIYEHGKFSHHATIETARALSGYAIGLVAYAAIKVVAPAFYALGRTRVPLIASVSAVAANLIWNVLTFRRFGTSGSRSARRWPRW